MLINQTAREPVFRRILLTQFYFTLVDEVDFEWLSKTRWCVLKQKTGERLYAARRLNNRFVLMHRIITNAPSGLDVDHINGNGLDNRRDNLRICTRSENLHNMRPRGGSSSFKGVSWNKRDQVWRAYINVNGSRHSLGSFRSEIDAAHAYDDAAREHFGDFAFCNFPETSKL